MRASRLLLPIVVTAALVTSCGDQDSKDSGSPQETKPADNGVAALPVEDIVSKSIEAASKATSVHVKGQVVDSSQTTRLDLKIGTDRGFGTISVGSQIVEIVRTATDVYLKGDAAFWRQFGGEAVAHLLGGKYLKAADSDPNFKSLADFVDTNTFFKNFADPSGKLSKGQNKVVNGVSTVAVVDNDPDDGGTLYIATQGQPYPVRVESVNGKGAIDFLDYGKALNVPIPATDQVVDVAKLKELAATPGG